MASRWSDAGEALELSFHCPAPWGAMRRVGAHARHCEQCDKRVTDLSSMTRAQARRWLEAHPSGSGACVAFWRDEDGAMVFAEAAALPAPSSAQLQGLRRLIAAATLALPLAFGACDAGSGEVGAAGIGGGAMEEGPALGAGADGGAAAVSGASSDEGASVVLGAREGRLALVGGVMGLEARRGAQGALPGWAREGRALSARALAPLASTADAGRAPGASRGADAGRASGASTADAGRASGASRGADASAQLRALALEHERREQERERRARMEPVMGFY